MNDMGKEETTKCRHSWIWREHASKREENKTKHGGLQPEMLSLRPVSMSASRESTPTTRLEEVRPPKYHRPQGGYHITPGGLTNLACGAGPPGPHKSA